MGAIFNDLGISPGKIFEVASILSYDDSLNEVQMSNYLGRKSEAQESRNVMKP